MSYSELLPPSPPFKMGITNGIPPGDQNPNRSRSHCPVALAFLQEKHPASTRNMSWNDKQIAECIASETKKPESEREPGSLEFLIAIQKLAGYMNAGNVVNQEHPEVIAYKKALEEFLELSEYIKFIDICKVTGPGVFLPVRAREKLRLPSFP